MAELLPFEVAIGRNANFQILGGEKGVNVKIHHRDPQKALPCAKTRRTFTAKIVKIDPLWRPVSEVKKRKKKVKKESHKQ